MITMMMVMMDEKSNEDNETALQNPKMSGLEIFLLLQCYLDEIFDGKFEKMGLCQYLSTIPTDSDSFGNFVILL